MALKFTTSYLEDTLALFRYYKKLSERAMEQLTDEQLFATLDDETNSIGIIVKHMAGNMRSRWTDFLSTDGEKPDRDRDTEFAAPPATRRALLELWEQGWERVFGALEDQLCTLTPDFDSRVAGYSPDRADALVWAISDLIDPEVAQTLLEYYASLRKP